MFLCVLCVHVGVCVWLNAHCCMVCVCLMFFVCMCAGVCLVKCALLHGMLFSRCVLVVFRLMCVWLSKCFVRVCVGVCSVTCALLHGIFSVCFVCVCWCVFG